MKINKNYSYLVYLLFIGLWGSIGSDPYNVLFLLRMTKNFYLVFQCLVLVIQLTLLGP